MIHDDVGRHIDVSGDFARAARPLGVYLAWCANHRLLAAEFESRAERPVMRVRCREITGSELVVAECGGTLSDECLNAEGRAFTRRHYPVYLEALVSCDEGAGRDEWALYDRMAPGLTEALMTFRGHGRLNASSRGKRRWWSWWR